MSFASIMHHYGYVVVFVATIFNIGTVLIIAGLAVHQGYLDLFPTLLVAFIGTLFFAHLYFVAGRKGTHQLLMKHPSWEAKMSHINHRIEHYQIAFTFGYRFIIGFRFLAPMFLGATHISYKYFAFLDFLGGLIWAVLFVLIGYYVGVAAEALLSEAGEYEEYCVIGIIVIAVAFWLYRRIQKKHSTKNLMS